MKRLALVAVAALTLAIATAAPAIPENTAHHNTPPEARCLLPSFEVFSGRVWRPAHWRRGDPPASTIAAAHRRIGCAASASHRHAMKAAWRQDRRAYNRYRELRLVAPYPGNGEWWAIPWPIVECESLSSGLWTAANPSGAVGPYQLLGHGAPYPADTWAEKIENHEIAGALYAESGTSPWVSSEACWG